MKKHLSGTELSQRFFERLSEKDKRMYATQEARRRGWGGASRVAQEYGIVRSTIRQGILDLESPDDRAECRIRKAGGVVSNAVDTAVRTFARASYQARLTSQNSGNDDRLSNSTTD